jgi:PEP-CTERM motif
MSMNKSLTRILRLVSIVAAGVAAVPTAAMAIPSVCDAIAGNLLANCGFEGGISSSGGGYEVPNGWTPSGGYEAGDFYQGPVTGDVHSGTYALQMANDVGEPIPALSQTIADTSGTTYKETFWLSYGGYGTGDTTGFFDAQLNGTNKLTFDYQTPSTYTAYSFDFVGTGSDTLTFTGNTNPSYWYLDDVSVVAVAVPEPSAVWMLLLGVGGLGVFMRKNFAGATAAK